MLIAQLLTLSSSGLDRKHQAIDARQLAQTDQVLSYRETRSGWVNVSNGEEIPTPDLRRILRSATLVHVYGEEPHPILKGLAAPYVAAFRPPRSRLPWKRLPSPALELLPGREALPEAVSEEFFSARERSSAAMVGSFLQTPARRRVVEQAIARINRSRDDVTWGFFTEPPTAEDLRTVQLWVDPAVDDEDVDGFTAEALAAGVAVVASRTAINEARLDRGMAGLLVRPNDANELAHLVLTALFKPELLESKRDAARLVAERFRPEKRAAKLRALYMRAIS